MPQPKPTVGYNIQITKICDLAGGQESVTINTAAPPGSSAEGIYSRIKLMRDALQKEIVRNVEAEQRRQRVEAERARGFLPSEQTPVPAPADPIAVEAAPNGNDGSA